jgi:AraC-like DNA-binding protein
MALPTTFAADRSAALDRFARSIAGADSAIDTLTAWCGGEPPVTRIHVREETVALPDEALLLRAPATVRMQRRHVTHRGRGGAVLCDARATVWLDHPLLPAQTVRRLRPEAVWRVMADIEGHARLADSSEILAIRILVYGSLGWGTERWAWQPAAAGVARGTQAVEPLIGRSSGASRASGTTVDRPPAAPPQTHRQALLQRIDGFIDQHLGDPELSPGMVATANHISVRYLHKLFQEHDLTVAAWIRRRRLDRCRRDLADPELWARPVGAIGARWGFIDGAHFSRVFRAAFGIPPRQYRRQAAMTSSPVGSRVCG